MPLRPLNNWLPQSIGLLSAAVIAVLATAPPAHSYNWPRLLGASAFIVILTTAVCAIAMALTYVVLAPKPDVGQAIRRTSATAAGFGPFVILLQQRSLWAPAVAAFLVWTILPARVDSKPHQTKFAGSITAAVLLQIGAAALLGEESIIAALAFGLAAAPILWRIRQERSLRGPFRPRAIIAIAALLAILSLTPYLPVKYGYSAGGAFATANGDNKRPGAAPGFSVGGKYRGVILSPEEEEHVILVPPIPMMGRDPFRLHKDPIGIPFYGVYWFFQAPDKAPSEDAVRVKGSPDRVAFHSADVNPLNMEAHQNLGRLIDLSACSRIDVDIRNADIIMGSLAMELILVNTSRPSHPAQTLGMLPILSKPGTAETLRFKIIRSSIIEQFDEFTVRFPRARYRATRSARVAIERFYLVPKEQ
jgi:hypothetical protein